MNKNYWIALFAIALTANIIGILVSDETVQWISKPLIVISLAGYFITTTLISISRLRKWILLALIFSWVGDVLLMFQSEKEIFFLLGLSSFLLAHIFYIQFFNRIRTREKLAVKWSLLLIAALYYAILITILFPYLGDMKWPVCIYGIVISCMFMLAMHMPYIKNRKIGSLMMTGALLFVISDSVLAINIFYQPLEILGAITIILTYGLAQYLIVEGAVRHLTSKFKE